MTVACGVSTNKGDARHVAVSISPLAWVVEGLLDSTVKVDVMVPAEMSPETYEPTARQMEDIGKAEILFTIGLIDFERQIEQRLRETTRTTKYIKLSDSLDLIQAVCHHQASEQDKVGDANHAHEHDALDPHVWLSPRMMRRMTIQMADELAESDINPRAAIYHRRDSLIGIIDSLDRDMARSFAKAKVKTFAIVHPSLAYMANDYSLRQIAIETDGKEPSGQSIKSLVDTLRALGVTTIIYSRQNPATAATVIAHEIAGQTVIYDPMAREWATNMKHITQIICKEN